MGKVYLIRKKIMKEYNFQMIISTLMPIIFILAKFGSSLKLYFSLQLITCATFQTLVLKDERYSSPGHTLAVFTQLSSHMRGKH